MPPLNCDAIEPLLDLYAADACDPADRSAVERHVRACPACSRALAEARDAAGWLDLHYQEPDRLARLCQRLRAEARPARPGRGVLPFARRYLAVAALLLVTFGLSGWLADGLNEGLSLTVQPPAERVAHGRASDQLPMHLKVPAAQEAAPGKPPGPAALDLVLHIVNRRPRPVVVVLGDERTELDLGLGGPGVREVPRGAGDPPPAWLRPREERLAPGASLDVSLGELTEGSRGRLRSFTWTRPGEYVLHPRLRFTCRDERGGPAVSEARGRPVAVTVVDP